MRFAFRDRADAGRQLAARVHALGLRSPVVLGLPRGGVPVAYEVSAALGSALDVLVARKVGAPGQPELGIGAVAEFGGRAVNDDALGGLGISREAFDSLASIQEAEVASRVSQYRGGRPLPPLDGADVVVVDDGLATGVTAEAAVRGVRTQRPDRVVLAVPVAASATAARLAGEGLADDVVTVLSPARFSAVGQWYDNFTQTRDDEVLRLLSRHH